MKFGISSSQLVKYGILSKSLTTKSVFRHLCETVVASIPRDENKFRRAVSTGENQWIDRQSENEEKT